MTAQAIETGAWSARWGEWQIYIREAVTGWMVIVWSWPVDTDADQRKQIGKARNLRDAETAINWASSLLKEHGAQAFVNGQKQPIAKFLNFTPAPEIVP